MQAPFSSTRTSNQNLPAWLTQERLQTGAVLLILLLLSIPVFTTGRSPLNSDQSLYLAEAINIADGHPTYPTGEPVVHRAPLYPAFLAGAFQLTGVSLDSAYIVPQISIIANVLLLFFLGRALFGFWGGAGAAIAAASSLYLRGIGTTLFLDSTQITFLLASLLVYRRAETARSVPLMAFAGGLLGASFLIKEASVLFLPLPLVVGLAFGFEPKWKQVLPAWFAGFAAATAWWWAWVYAHTGKLFLVGEPQGELALMLLAVLALGAGCTVALLRFAPPQFEASKVSRTAAVLVLTAWNALFFVGLESQGWAFDSDYLGHTASYLANIFLPNVQPAPLILAAWAWLIWSALRARPEATFLAICALLYASFFLLVADRGLSLRDQLPMIYVSYLALGGLTAGVARYAARIDLGLTVRSFGGAGAVGVVIVLGAIVIVSGSSASRASVVTLQDGWENPLARETASWLNENIEPGAPIMASRLYYSHVYFLTGGDYAIHQLPTVEVDLRLDPGSQTPLSRASTLFRWEQHLMPADSVADQWLYLTRYPVKGYLIGLAENDLLLELERRDAEYVVLATLDAGFSSPSFTGYFEDNPAFELLHVITASPHDEVRIYRADLDRLQPQQQPAQVTQSAYEYVVNLIGGETPASDYLSRINSAGFELTER